MSAIKEPHFFLKPGDGIWAIEDQLTDPVAYERLFETKLPLRGEASTSYSHFPARRGVPTRIKDRVPDARFIYLVRDPIERLVSHYRHQVVMEGERRSLPSAIGNLRDPENIYICGSLYALQLDQYLSEFPADRIHVVDQAELRSNRAATLKGVLRFLGAAPQPDLHLYDSEFNQTADYRVYPVRYARLRGKEPLQYAPRRLKEPLRKLTRAAERRLWPAVETPTVPPSLREELELIFREDVNRLRAITGMPFSSWSM